MNTAEIPTQVGIAKLPLFDITILNKKTGEKITFSDVLVDSIIVNTNYSSYLIYREQRFIHTIHLKTSSLPELDLMTKDNIALQEYRTSVKP